MEGSEEQKIILTKEGISRLIDSHWRDAMNITAINFDEDSEITIKSLFSFAYHAALEDIVFISSGQKNLDNLLESLSI